MNIIKYMLKIYALDFVSKLYELASYVFFVYIHRYLIFKNQ